MNLLVLHVIDESAQILFEGLILLLHLSVCLRMVCSPEPAVDT